MTWAVGSLVEEVDLSSLSALRRSVVVTVHKRPRAKSRQQEFLCRVEL